MRQDIDIQPLETTPGRSDFNALTISFTAETPQLAQEVTSRLTSVFIEQNLKTRGEQATGTTQFLSGQLDAAKQRLAEQEQRLQAFKSSNLGELPEQQSVNLAALMDVRTRLNAVSFSLSQARQQRHDGDGVRQPVRRRRHSARRARRSWRCPDRDPQCATVCRC